MVSTRRSLPHRQPWCILKAFNSVDHTLLLKQLSASTINPHVMRWLATYTRGRSACCLFRFSVSSSLIIHSGVPQGSVISPALFNFFTSDFPLTSPSFADDFNLVKSSPDLQTLTSKLNSDLKLVKAWADSKTFS
jgi:ribonuclease P/MRP protein subunit RPP40